MSHAFFGICYVWWVGIEDEIIHKSSDFLSWQQRLVISRLIDLLPLFLGGLLLFNCYLKFLFCGLAEGVRLIKGNKKLLWQRLLIYWKQKCNVATNAIWMIVGVLCTTQVSSAYLMSVLSPAITPMNNFCCSYSSPSKWDIS